MNRSISQRAADLKAMWRLASDSHQPELVRKLAREYICLERQRLEWLPHVSPDVREILLDVSNA